MKTINLEEILKIYDIHTGTKHQGANIDVEIRNAMLEFGKQLLELAAENTKLNEGIWIPVESKWSEESFQINKQSILDTINKVE
jgi:hypothetical protein